ncbi:aminopeptidase P family protein [Candidatus Woesearchaeota archaeon]|nr:aminopeptidase P family protein [Candidatus Woesearchaeota archaeon]
MWTKRQIKLYEQAAEHLYHIQRLAFQQAKGKTEYEIQQFILQAFKQRNMKTSHPPIVAFNEHAAEPHYQPKSRGPRLQRQTLVLIDLWARMNEKKAPFADITWMGYYGTPPKKVKEIFGIVIKARDKGINVIKQKLRKKQLPTGSDVDIATTNVLRKHNYMDYCKHRTGHSLGTTSPHGRYRAVVDKNKHQLHANLGYTIEPGLYLDGRFGVRSEVDFYVIKGQQLRISKKQTSITLI